MTPKVESTQLFKWLNGQNAELASRIVTIRKEVAKWLQHVIQSFPHYPSHGVDHSDRIVAQLSKVLFNKTKSAVPFSVGEIYCLLCAAYVHDMGMVVPPGEVATLLASDNWKAFVAPGQHGHEKFREYQALRIGPIQDTKEQTDFLADLALRRLIAEFVRRDHHERGRTTLELHPFLKQFVDDGDSVAFETIADLGVAHGLSDSDIADESRFPEERDVLGDKVNVRFLARLLRIGDLLDMDTQRADPMTAKAVAPLPPDAVPHWQQYSSKKHENISPKVIEFRFECKDQLTHRVLRDWFGWLEAEVRNAALEQLHAARHDKWRSPRCIVSSQPRPDHDGLKSKPTIIIKPAQGASYFFHDWKLELDHERILERLIYDVYAEPSVFIRELVQNSLDATRCQMYADFEVQNPGIPLPERPTQFPLEFRDRYPVVLALTEEEVKPSPDAPSENRTVFTIEDRGTGMNEQIITRYFLQIGRSYYQSNEFRERYKFVPTSRFGVGFLSVFAVSNDITVDTARRDDATGKVEGLRLNLRKPRNYLLTEPWAPFPERPVTCASGTRIRVVLDTLAKEVSLPEIVRRWCVAVEVPVVVREAAQETVIRAERFVDKTVLAASKVDPNGRFILRSFDLNTHGVEGQIAIIAYEDEKGEGWCDCWPKDMGLDGEREDALPKRREQLTALHGILLTDYSAFQAGQWLMRADVRSTVQGITVDRSMSMRRRSGFRRPGASDANVRGFTSTASQAVHDAVRRAVQEHLGLSLRANGERGTLYRGRVLSGAPVAGAWREGGLLSDAPVADDWRDEYPATVVTWQSGQRKDISVAELLALEELVFATWVMLPEWQAGPTQPMKRHPREVQASVSVVSWSETPGFSDDRFSKKVRAMNLCDVKRDEDLWLFTFSNTRTGDGFERAHPDGPSWLAPLSLSGVSGLRLESLGSAADPFTVLDRRDPVVQWLSSLRVAAIRKPAAIDPADVEACWLTAAKKPWAMSDLIAKWASDPRVPEALKPPKDVEGHLLRLNVFELRGRGTLSG